MGSGFRLPSNEQTFSGFQINFPHRLPGRGFLFIAQFYQVRL